MASLGVFAQRIRRRGRQVTDGVNREVARVAAAALQAVVLATPVRTGRARGGWQVGLGGPPLGGTGRLDPSGGATISSGTFRLSARLPEQTVYISNNVAYIGKLNAGSSAQAPAGFVQTAAQVGASAARSARVLR